jgi:hypothetical protein
VLTNERIFRQNVDGRDKPGHDASY